MTIVKGINAGFVKISPTADPSGSASNTDNYADGIRDVAPAGAVRVTEIGWWCDNATIETNYEVGIYSHDAINNKPDQLMGVSRTNAKGTGSGWKKVTGLNISISAGTIYWIVIQIDSTQPTNTNGNYTVSAGDYVVDVIDATTLPDPWSGEDSIEGYYYARYAVYDTTHLQTSGDGLNWVVCEQ